MPQCQSHHEIFFCILYTMKNLLMREPYLLDRSIQLSCIDRLNTVISQFERNEKQALRYLNNALEQKNTQEILVFIKELKRIRIIKEKIIIIKNSLIMI